MWCPQLVEVDLRFEAGERLAAESDSDNDDIPLMKQNTLFSIPGVHLTFDAIQSRVHIFSQLVEAWPECVSKLINMQQQPMVCISIVCIFLANVSNVCVENFC